MEKSQIKDVNKMLEMADSAFIATDVGLITFGGKPSDVMNTLVIGVKKLYEKAGFPKEFVKECLELAFMDEKGLDEKLVEELKKFLNNLQNNK